MKVRPISITVIAWLLIMTGIISLLIGTLFLTSPETRAWLTGNPRVFPVVLYLMLPYPYAGPVTTIAAGIGMLKGQNWARLLFAIWWGYAAFLVSVGTPSSMRLEMVSGIGVFLVAVFFLFRPKANRYFSTIESVGGSSDDHPTPLECTTPLESSSQPHPFPEKNALRRYGLVNASLFLAIIMEVLPTEADTIFMAFQLKLLWLFLVGKAVCLAIILSPLLLFIWINGWKGIVAAKWKIAVISIIVSLKLAMDMYCILNW